MKAGRELDALIAEKVMDGILRDSEKYEFWDDPPAIRQIIEMRIDESTVMIDEFYPSTQIADAWMVVEKANLLDDYEMDKDGEWYQFGHHGEYGFDEWELFVRAKTAPLAICLAALKAAKLRNTRMLI